MPSDDRKAVHLGAEARMRLKLLAAVRGVNMQDLMSALVNEAFEREAQAGTLRDLDPGQPSEHVCTPGGGA
ncbi:MAG: hypothetical protein WC683_01395 [bacterium]